MAKGIKRAITNDTTEYVILRHKSGRFSKTTKAKWESEVSGMRLRKSGFRLATEAEIKAKFEIAESQPEQEKVEDSQVDKSSKGKKPRKETRTGNETNSETETQ